MSLYSLQDYLRSRRHRDQMRAQQTHIIRIYVFKLSLWTVLLFDVQLKYFSRALSVCAVRIRSK